MILYSYYFFPSISFSSPTNSVYLYICAFFFTASLYISIEKRDLFYRALRRHGLLRNWIYLYLYIYIYYNQPLRHVNEGGGTRRNDIDEGKDYKNTHIGSPGEKSHYVLTINRKFSYGFYYRTYIYNLYIIIYLVAERKREHCVPGSSFRPRRVNT